VKGVQSSAQFAAGTEGRLTLAIGVWTGAIAALVCLFLMSGQHHYLRGSLPGVGSALLRALMHRAREEGFHALSLSVAAENRARLLYERAGFQKIGEHGGSWTMLARL
jgi:hypothetical protein